MSAFFGPDTRVDALPASALRRYKDSSLSSIESTFHLSSTATQETGVKDPARIFPAAGEQNYAQAISTPGLACEIFFGIVPDDQTNQRLETSKSENAAYIFETSFAQRYQRDPPSLVIAFENLCRVSSAGTRITDIRNCQRFGPNIRLA